jgi:hypothetical protein
MALVVVVVLDDCVVDAVAFVAAVAAAADNTDVTASSCFESASVWGTQRLAGWLGGFVVARHACVCHVHVAVFVSSRNSLYCCWTVLTTARMLLLALHRSGLFFSVALPYDLQPRPLTLRSISDIHALVRGPDMRTD